MADSAKAFEEYLQGLRLVRGSGAGVDELSYYHPLATLLNATGQTLKPHVRCVMNLRNRGAGLPDGGLFTRDQFGRNSAEEQILEQVPARGAIEVKGTMDDIDALAASEQVARYCQRYGQVLATNLRDFSLVVWDRNQAVQMETYRLARDEPDFWSKINQPRAFADEHGQRFIEYLRRVMLHGAPLSNPEDLAWLLASYARDARMRIEDIQLHALTTVRRALEDALGLTFEGERGNHFFRSTLVQTLFYGIFSAWVLWHNEFTPGKHDEFQWRNTTWILHVPMIRALFEQIATPSRLGALNLVEVLDWAGAALNRVDRAAFFERFEQGNAVQYFYEPFLEAFDPQLRKDLGIWYTPHEVVQYMVARVDRVLREELDLPDGLADSSVYVLDPATGTGSYLVEVLRTIERTLRAKGDDALAAHDVKRAALERVIGFEILPAPFVVGHLQIGLYLQSIGAPLTDEKLERAAIYLTNALTGWQATAVSGENHVQTILDNFPELLEERDQAQTVKQKTPVLVVLGNPPYNGYAGIAMGQERVLTDAYRTAKRTRQPQGQGLNDLYVRFFRMAERRIVEGTGKGVVCLITNYSWLDGLSFTGMREHYLDVFDQIWIDNLHGDRIISEYAPDGRTSETVFAVQGSSVGIKIGTAISLLVKNNGQRESGDAELHYRDLDEARAAERRAALITSLERDDFSAAYTQLSPSTDLGLPFKPRLMAEGYVEWPLLPDLFPTSFPGVKTSRDDVVVDIDRDRLIRRMEQYFDPSVSHDEMRRIAPRIMTSGARFVAEEVRDHLLARGFLRENVVRYYYRPFDMRWLYWEPETKLLDEKRPEYFPQVFESNLWIGAAQRHRKDWDPPVITGAIGSLHVIERGANLFPLKRRTSLRELGGLFTSLDESAGGSSQESFNLSPAAQAYISLNTPPPYRAFRTSFSSHMRHIALSFVR